MSASFQCSVHAEHIAAHGSAGRDMRSYDRDSSHTWVCLFRRSGLPTDERIVASTKKPAIERLLRRIGAREGTRCHRMQISNMSARKTKLLNQELERFRKEWLTVGWVRIKVTSADDQIFRIWSFDDQQTARR